MTRSISHWMTFVSLGRGVPGRSNTPVTPSAYLSERLGDKSVLKAENLQRTGAFKIRGALNKVAHLGSATHNGVVGEVLVITPRHSHSRPDNWKCRA